MHLSSTNPRCHRLVAAGLLSLLAVGCGPSFRAFSDRQSEKVCEVMTTCFDSHATVDDCVQDIGVGRDEVDRREDCQGYLAGRARQCLRNLQAQADDCPATELEDWRVPAICGEVCVDDRQAEPERLRIGSTDTGP